MVFSGSMTIGSSYQKRERVWLCPLRSTSHCGNHGFFVPTKGSSSTSKISRLLYFVDDVDVRWVPFDVPLVLCDEQWSHGVLNSHGEVVELFQSFISLGWRSN